MINNDIGIGDIIKSTFDKTHYVVGGISMDGCVVYGYKISDRSNVRLEAHSCEIVYSTKEKIYE